MQKKWMLLYLYGQIYNEEEFSFSIFVPQRLERAKLQSEIGSKRWFCGHSLLSIAYYFLVLFLNAHTYTHTHAHSQKLSLVRGREGSLFSKSLLCGLWDRRSGNNQQEL